MKGMGGLLIAAIVFTILKPLLLGIWQGLVVLFTGKVKK